MKITHPFILFQLGTNDFLFFFFWGYFTTTTFFHSNLLLFVGKMWIKILVPGGFHFFFFWKSESSLMMIFWKNYHLWTWGAMTTSSRYPLLALLSRHGISCTVLPCAVTVQDHTCCSLCLVGSISGDCNSALCSFSSCAECLVWKALHEQPLLKSAKGLAKIKSSIFVTFWLSEPNLKTLLQWSRFGLGVPGGFTYCLL